MAGKRTDEVVNHWREALQLEHVETDALENDVVEAVLSSIINHGKELPGVFHILEILKSNGIPMAVASSSSQIIIDTVLSTLGLKDYFEFSYSAKNEPHGKPHPGVFITTAKRLGFKPGNCVVFEDAISGVQAAKAAHMLCIAVPESANYDKPEYDIADLKVPSLEVVNWETIKALND